MIVLIILILLNISLTIILSKYFLDNLKNTSRFISANFFEIGKECGRGFYNARKRDEKILRVIRLNNRDAIAKIGAIYESIICAHNDIDKVAKQCRSIEGVVRMCGNNDTDFNSKLNGLHKDLKECNRILGLFEAMTERAKSGTKI